MEIYQMGIGLFLQRFAFHENDKRRLLAWQLGKQRSPCAPLLAGPNKDAVGKLCILDGNACITMFQESDATPEP